MEGKHTPAEIACEASNLMPPRQQQQQHGDDSSSHSLSRRRRLRRLGWLEAPFRPPTTGWETADGDNDGREAQRLLPQAHHPDEATAWAMDAAAKGPLNMSGVFLAAALLRLAEAETESAPGDGSGGKVFGLRPSSLLTASSVVVTLSAAVLMPLFGALVDYTPHRRRAGAATALVIVLINGCQSFVSPGTWRTMLLLQVLSNFLYVVHTTIVLAYLPDLTADEDLMAGYTSWFSIVHFVAVAAYVGVVVLIGVLATGASGGDSTLRTAQTSHVLSFVVSTPLLLYAWAFVFAPRPPLHDLPRGRSVWTAGFTELGSTIGEILGLGSSYPSLRIFMLALLWCPDAGSGNYIGIFVTFLSEQMRQTGAQIGLTNFILLVSTIPGSYISKYLCVRYDALSSFRLCLGWWILTNTLAAWLLTGPERAPLIYFPFSVMWGIQFGWLFPSQRVLFCTLIPPGRETELMGMFAFFGQALGWLPPLFFSWINEAGWSMRLGLASADIFLLLALVTLWFIRDYRAAVQQAKLL